MTRRSGYSRYDLVRDNPAYREWLDSNLRRDIVPSRWPKPSTSATAPCAYPTRSADSDWAAGAPMIQIRAMIPPKTLDDDGNDLACQIAMEDALHDVLNHHLKAEWDRDEVATSAMKLVNALCLGRVEHERREARIADARRSRRQ